MSDKPTLGKQLAGAVIGGTLALGLYYGYEFAQPYAAELSAYVTLPGGDVERAYDPSIARINDSSLEEDEAKRFASRNRRVAERQKALNPDAEQQYLETDDINPYEAEWQDYKKEDSEENESVVDIEWPDEGALMEYEEDSTAGTEEEKEPWEDLFGEDAVDRSRDYTEPKYDKESVVRNADDLTSSGVETWILILAALGGAGYVRWRKVGVSSS